MSMKPRPTKLRANGYVITRTRIDAWVVTCFAPDKDDKPDVKVINRTVHEDEDAAYGQQVGLYKDALKATSQQQAVQRAAQKLVEDVAKPLHKHTTRKHK